MELQDLSVAIHSLLCVLTIQRGVPEEIRSVKGLLTFILHTVHCMSHMAGPLMMEPNYFWRVNISCCNSSLTVVSAALKE